MSDLPPSALLTSALFDAIQKARAEQGIASLALLVTFDPNESMIRAFLLETNAEDTPASFREIRDVLIAAGSVSEGLALRDAPPPDQGFQA